MYNIIYYYIYIFPIIFSMVISGIQMMIMSNKNSMLFIKLIVRSRRKFESHCKTARQCPALLEAYSKPREHDPSNRSTSVDWSYHSEYVVILRCVDFVGKCRGKIK